MARREYVLGWAYGEEGSRRAREAADRRRGVGRSRGGWATDGAGTDEGTGGGDVDGDEGKWTGERTSTGGDLHLWRSVMVPWGASSGAYASAASVARGAGLAGQAWAKWPECPQ